MYIQNKAIRISYLEKVDSSEIWTINPWVFSQMLYPLDHRDSWCFMEMIVVQWEMTGDAIYKTKFSIEIDGSIAIRHFFLPKTGMTLYFVRDPWLSAHIPEVYLYISVTSKVSPWNSRRYSLRS